MKRPATVVTIAVIAFAGSGLLVLFAALMMAGMLLQASAALPAGALTSGQRAGAMVTLAAGYLLPAAWGMVTAIGLLRMRLWAVASTLVFAYGLVWISAFFGAVLGIFLVPAGAAAAGLMRVVAFGLASCMAGLGVWWLAYFGRNRVRAQFAASGGWARRPLSISLLGWASAVSGGCSLAAAFLPQPAFDLFGWPISGLSARLVWLAMAAAMLTAGVGLLRLRPWARRLALVLLVAGTLDGVLTWVLSQGMWRSMQAAAASNPAMAVPELRQMLFAVVVYGTFVMVITYLLSLYFLWTRGSAFRPPAPAPAA